MRQRSLPPRGPADNEARHRIRTPPPDKLVVRHYPAPDRAGPTRETNLHQWQPSLPLEALEIVVKK